MQVIVLSKTHTMTVMLTVMLTVQDIIPSGKGLLVPTSVLAVGLRFGQTCNDNDIILYMQFAVRRGNPVAECG